MAVGTASGGLDREVVWNKESQETRELGRTGTTRADGHPGVLAAVSGAGAFGLARSPPGAECAGGLGGRLGPDRGWGWNEHLGAFQFGLELERDGDPEERPRPRKTRAVPLDSAPDLHRHFAWNGGLSP